MSWDWEICLLKLIKGPNRETVYHRYYCLLVLLRAFLLLNWFKNISLKSFVIHRYVEENVRRFGMYRRYNKVFP